MVFRPARTKASSFSSKVRAKATAREFELAKLRVEQLKEKALLRAIIGALDAQKSVKEAEQEFDTKEN